MFPALDVDNDVSTLIHFSPRAPGGYFTAKFNVAGEKFRHRALPRSAGSENFIPVRDECLMFEVIDPAKHFHIVYDGPDIHADLHYKGRFPPWDFSDAQAAWANPRWGPSD